VNPEQQISLQKPKVQDLPGQQKLFDGSTDGRGGHEGYFRRLYEQTESHVVQPLIDELKDLDAGLARRIADKYSDYPFDHGSKELDLKIDQATAYYMKKVKSDREHADEWQAEYREKTDRPVKGLNAKKRKLLVSVPDPPSTSTEKTEDHRMVEERVSKGLETQRCSLRR
jgi:hypothetical protein